MAATSVWAEGAASFGSPSFRHRATGSATRSLWPQPGDSSKVGGSSIFPRATLKAWAADRLPSPPTAQQSTLRPAPVPSSPRGRGGLHKGPVAQGWPDPAGLLRVEGGAWLSREALPNAPAVAVEQWSPGCPHTDWGHGLSPQGWAAFFPGTGSPSSALLRSVVKSVGTSVFQSQLLTTFYF